MKIIDWLKWANKKDFCGSNHINGQIRAPSVTSETVFVTEDKNIFQTRGWHRQVNSTGGRKFPSRTYEANIVSHPIGKDGKL